MSVIVTANYLDETFEVEIFRDGGIDFPDRDLQYEQALAEFYPPGSAIVRLYEVWIQKPMKIISHNLELPKNAAVRLAINFAEKALPIFENQFKTDQRPRNAIEAAKDYVRGNVDLPKLRLAMDEARDAEGYTQSGGAAEYAAEGAAGAAAAAGWAAWAAAAGTAGASGWLDVATALYESANSLAWAVAEVASDAPCDSPEWRRPYHDEEAWQLRRFVDCMEAIGQGKDWPDLKVTK